MSVDSRIYLCATTRNKIKVFLKLQKVPLSLLSLITTPPPPSNHFLFRATIDLPILECHINRIIQYAFFLCLSLKMFFEIHPCCTRCQR